MKKYSELKEQFSRLVEAKKSRSHAILKFFDKYMTNNHYLHMTDKPRIEHSYDGDPPYSSTPLAHYAWQVNSYRKEIMIHAARRIEDAAMLKTLDIKTSKNLSSNDRMVRDIFDGDAEDFVMIRVPMALPYTQTRPVMIVLEAKRGLKWLRVKRLSEKEQKLILEKTLEDFFKDRKKFMTPSELADIMKRVMSEKIFSNQQMVEEFGKLAKAKKMKFSIGDAPWQDLADRVFRVHGMISKAKINNNKEFQSAVVWMLFDVQFIRRKGQGVKESGEFLTKLGYDAFRDDSNIGAGGVLYTEEPAQVGFLNKKAFKIVDIYGREDFKLYAEDLLEFEKILKKQGQSISSKELKYLKSELKLMDAVKKKPKAKLKEPKPEEMVTGKIVKDISKSW
jgi:hypothetical protein